MAKRPIGGPLAVELQFKGEAASSLGAAARALESAIAQLVALRAKAADAREMDLELLRRQYRESHKHAVYRKWCLIVQREAIGLKSHHDLYITYPIPPPLDF